MRKVIKNTNKAIKIFVLDDEVGIVDSVISFLEKYDFECSGTTSPDKALEVLSQEAYDVLVLDFYMENILADKFVSTLRKTNKDIIVILLTGYGGTLNPITLIDETEIDFYCEKGTDFNQLLIKVKEATKVIEKFRAFSSNALNKQTFGERLKKLREEHNITQAEFAGVIGVGRTTIANYESNFSEPNLDVLIKIARYFKVSIDYLLCYF